MVTVSPVSRISQIDEVDKTSFNGLPRERSCLVSIALVWEILSAIQDTKAKTHLLSIFDAFRKRRNLQRETKPSPGIHVIDVCPIDAVELKHRGCFGVIVSLRSFGVIAIPVKKVAHSINLLTGWLIPLMRKFWIMGKEFVKVV